MPHDLRLSPINTFALTLTALAAFGVAPPALAAQIDDPGAIAIAKPAVGDRLPAARSADAYRY
jgi:hypothetical protein